MTVFVHSDNASEWAKTVMLVSYLLADDDTYVFRHTLGIRFVIHIGMF